jgi:hypothetical protein
MNSVRLAVTWCAYAIAYLVLLHLMDAYVPQDWIIKGLSFSKDTVSSHGATRIAFEVQLLLSLLLNSVLIWLTARVAYAFMNPVWRKNNTRPRQKIKLLLIWHAFFVTYVVIFALSNLALPEAWLYRLFMGMEMPCDDVVWDGIIGGITLALALPINGAFVAFVSSKAIKRKQLRQSAQQKTTCPTSNP